jgi:PAS domain S-box-containing protein
LRQINGGAAQTSIVEGQPSRDVAMGSWMARILRSAIPYAGALAVVALAAGLVGTIALTRVDLQWLAFLAGVLMAASLALASKASSNAWTIARRGAQLAVAREKLAAESVLRERAEQAVAGFNRSNHYIDDLFPAMLSYVDPARRVLFHNRAYAEWLGMPDARLDGRELAGLLGEDWAAIAMRLDEAFAGSVVRYERTQRMADGHPCRIAALYLPRFGHDGKVAGVFSVLADVTSREDRAGQDQATYSKALAGELTEWHDVAERLACAIAKDEFTLFSQDIVPAAHAVRAPPFHEILLRLREEEDNLMPPGAFLPLAEQHNLLPDLDMWVVGHLLDWAAAGPGRELATYSVNVSSASMADPAFLEFVRRRQRALAGRGPTLCFEFNEADAVADLESTRDFVRALRAEGCRFALAGFGRAPVSFTLPRKIAFDFIKIEPSLVLAAARSPVQLAQVKAINQVAHSLGAKTVAECVESDAVRRTMADAGVDFVQGFAISRPAPIAGLEAAAAAARAA